MKKFCFVLLLIFVLLIGVACGKKGKELVQNSEKIESESTPIEVVATPMGTYQMNESETKISAERDGNIAYVSSEDSFKVVIKGKEEVTIKDSLNLITSIETLEWIDDKHLAVISHINPSLQCFMVYDLEESVFLYEKYGLEFQWYNGDINSLIYISPKPHSSENSELEKVKDENDNILFEAKEGFTITKLAWVDKNTIKFILTNSNNETEEKVIEVQ